MMLGTELWAKHQPLLERAAEERKREAAQKDQALEAAWEAITLAIAEELENLSLPKVRIRAVQTTPGNAVWRIDRSSGVELRRVPLKPGSPSVEDLARIARETDFRANAVGGTLFLEWGPEDWQEVQ